MVGFQTEEIKTMKTARKRILVADCHEEVLIVLEKLLEDTGFDTTTVWTAQEALRLVESQAFDLALINEYLPDAECEELLRAFRERGAQVPCIVMQPSAPEITDIRSLQRPRSTRRRLQACLSAGSGGRKQVHGLPQAGITGRLNHAGGTAV